MNSKGRSSARRPNTIEEPIVLSSGDDSDVEILIQESSDPDIEYLGASKRYDPDAPIEIPRQPQKKPWHERPPGYGQAGPSQTRTGAFRGSSQRSASTSARRPSVRASPAESTRNAKQQKRAREPVVIEIDVDAEPTRKKSRHAPTEPMIDLTQDQEQWENPNDFYMEDGPSVAGPSQPRAYPTYESVNSDPPFVAKYLPKEESPDSDWELYHAGYVWRRSPSPPPHPAPKSKPLDLVLEQLADLTITNHMPNPDCRVYMRFPQNQYRPLPSSRRSSTRHVRRKNPSNNRDSNCLGVPAQSLERVHAFRSASGAVSVITQSGQNAAIASTAIVSTDTPWELDMRARNEPGALLFWSQDQASTPRHPVQASSVGQPSYQGCHFRDNVIISYPRYDDTVTETTRVYYSVTDVKFDPMNPTEAVSSGCDGIVRSWSAGSGATLLPSHRELSCPKGGNPYFLEFRPQSSILAIGCEDGKCHVQTSPKGPFQALQSRSTRYTTTALAWGLPSTAYADVLLVGGGNSDTVRKGPKGRGVNYRSGFTRGWTIGESRLQPTFDLRLGDKGGYCECLALNPKGHNLAVISSTSNHESECQACINMFDLRVTPIPIYRKRILQGNGHRSSYSPAEVSSCSFSADGTLLSCALDNSTAYVWDCRFIKDNVEPLRKLQHGPSRSANSSDGFTYLSWVTHQGLSSPPLVVTGSADGKIIQWDMRSQDSTVLAELEGSVGYFHLGDYMNGEMPLIAGDYDGMVYIYDFKGHFKSDDMQG